MRIPCPKLETGVLKALAKKRFRPNEAARESNIVVENATGKFVVVPRKNEIKREGDARRDNR